MLLNPVPGMQLASANETFSWAPVSGAQNYWLDVGTGYQSGNIFGGVVTGTSQTVAVTCATAATPIYVQLFTRVNNVWLSPLNYRYTCNNSDSRALISRPIPATSFGTSILASGTQTFSWTSGANAGAFWLDVGTSVGQGNISAGQLTSTSKTVSNINCSGGSIIYVRLGTQIGGTWQTPLDYTYTCNLSENRAQLLSQLPGSRFPSASHMFNWSTGAGADSYWLDVGTAQGAGDLSAGELTATSKFIQNLPVNGSAQIW